MACCTVFDHYRMLVILVVTGIYDKSKLDLEVLVLFWGFLCCATILLLMVMIVQFRLYRM